MQTEIIKVTGMTCGGCSSAVSKALKSSNGVYEVNVSLSSAEAIVQYDETLTSPEQLKLAIKEAGYGIGASNATPQLQGKSCCG